MSNNIYAALEIGTTRTALAIGEAQSGGRIRVSHPIVIPSSGVRKSQILDIPMASQSIHAVIRGTEDSQGEAGARVSIGNAYLVISGQHVKADRFQGTTQVERENVSIDDINEVGRLSRRMTLARDRELLDIVDQDYVLDNLGGIASPKGMAGRILKLNTLQIHADRNRVQDARTAAAEARLEIREPLFAATCAAEAVLEDHERRNGALVLDLGGGSTGYAVYSDGYPISAGVIGVGGDHVTNDIAHAFQTTNVQAETIKVTEASALVTANANLPSRIKVPGSSPLMETRTISRRALDTVVNARLKELFAVIGETLEDQDLLQRLHAGVVLTGGGAALRDIAQLAEQTLGMSVRTGVPIHVDGLAEEPHPESFAALAGALLYAHRSNEEKPFFENLFGGLFK